MVNLVLCGVTSVRQSETLIAGLIEKGPIDESEIQNNLYTYKIQNDWNLIKYNRLIQLHLNKKKSLSSNLPKECVKRLQTFFLSFKFLLSINSCRARYMNLYCILFCTMPLRCALTSFTVEWTSISQLNPAKKYYVIGENVLYLKSHIRFGKLS